MKIVVTTSDRYLHLLPIFCFLFNKYWHESEDEHTIKMQKVEIVGYKKPDFELPFNFTFHSLGEQIGDATNFTKDLREYFKQQDQFFIWMMEDTFLRANVNFNSLNLLKSLTNVDKVGRIYLSDDIMRREGHFTFGKYDDFYVYQLPQDSIFRLSTQASIWNRDFLLMYMQKDLSPWQFESQADTAIDDYHVVGLGENPVVHVNEGVRKTNIYQYDLNRIDENVINEMKQLQII